MNRRLLLTGLTGLIAAPAVLRLGTHMPVRAVEVEPFIHVTWSSAQTVTGETVFLLDVSAELRQLEREMRAVAYEAGRLGIDLDAITEAHVAAYANTVAFGYAPVA